MTLQANPFVVAAAVAITGVSAIIATDWFAVDSLTIHRIASTDAPVLDGDTSDPVWRNIQPFSLMTNHGGNFDGRGESRIDIRAVHDDTWAYFLFTWDDPTRSLKQLPLIKHIDGWHVLHDGYERGDEQAFNEDKFAVLLTTMDVDLAGDRTFHASPQPLAGAPVTMTGRGLHFTPQGTLADVWQWKATSGGPTGWMDDDHFGPPLKPTPMQVKTTVPYRGGFEPDPGTGNYANNFEMPIDATDADPIVTPLRLPKGSRGNLGRDGPNIARSKRRRERWCTLVHDRSRDRAVYTRGGPAHSRRDGASGRHHFRRFFRRSRRCAMRGPLGLRALGARGRAPARYRQQI
jgi:hypothetical protein